MDVGVDSKYSVHRPSLRLLLVCAGLNASQEVAVFMDPVAVALSEVVKFQNLNEPTQGHLSLTTNRTEMA